MNADITCGLDYRHYNNWDDLYDKLVLKDLNGDPILRNSTLQISIIYFIVYCYGVCLVFTIIT